MITAEVLRGKWLITERRGGATFKTKFIGNEWVPMDSPAGKMHTVGDVQWTSPTVEPTAQTIRTVVVPDKEDS